MYNVCLFSSFYWKKIFSSNINNKETESILDLLSLKKYTNTPINYLSQGEIKKLEISRLILEQKKLWILDEPYNHLDDISTEILNQTFLDHLNNNGIILFTSHFDPMIDNLETLDFN